VSTCKVNHELQKAYVVDPPGNLTEFLYNETITLQCLPGYGVLDGSNVTTCDHFNWTAVPLQCQPGKENVFETRRNRALDINKRALAAHTYGQCFKNIRFVKIQRNILTTFASYNQLKLVLTIIKCICTYVCIQTVSIYLTCVTDCGTPVAPLHGSVNYSFTTLNSTAVFSCNTSYNLVGNSSVTCNASGMWSGNATCIIGK